MNPPILVIDGDEMFSTALTLALRSYEFDARQLAITGGTAAILAQIRHLPAGLALLDPHLGHDEHGHCIDGVELVNPLRACGWADWWSVTAATATEPPRLPSTSRSR